MPVDWAVAAATAQRLIGSGPVVPKADAELAVRQLRELSMTAEGHVREVTGLGADLPLLPGEVVDRPRWAAAAAEGLEALLGTALAEVSAKNRVSGLFAGSAGMQAGLVLAYLGTKVLGQYDPFGGAPAAGRLLLVAPNVVGAEQALSVPPADFRLWVCLHESTHRLQFTAVPWLREHFVAEVTALMSTMDETMVGLLGRLPETLRSARQSRDNGPDPIALIELLQSPAQRVVLDRLIALSTLLEGHADHVMDAVGPAVVPSVATIRARFTVRRQGGGLLDRLLRALLGVDAKIRQYAQGAAFTGTVVDTVGMAGFNAVWSSPETLPTRREIHEPEAWIRRVHG